MSHRETRLYIDGIEQSIAHIEEYVRGLSFEDFACDPKTMDAVIRNFEVMGEAATNLPDDFKARHPKMPWGKMIGMRNKVAHEYFGVDPEIIWKTILEDIPELKTGFAQLGK